MPANAHVHPAPLRLLLVDDNPAFLDCIDSLVRATPGIQVVGTASTGLQAIDRARETLPDLILMDLAMPDMNGLEASRKIKAEHPSVRIVMVSLHSGNEYLASAQEVGADAFLPKADLCERLFNTIESLFPNRD